MPDADPLGPLIRLRQQVESELAQRGLHLEYLSVTPAAAEGGRHEVQLMATLAGTPPTQPIDDGFEDVLRGARAAEVERRTQETIDDLKRRMGNDGFL